MRIQIASDLHLEFLEKAFPGYLGVEPCGADILILAGDIANGTRALDLFSTWPCPVIYVPGNHEFYESSMQDVLAEFKERSARYPNISVLAPGSVEVAGVRFVGCTLWTDYEVFGADRKLDAMAECARRIYDHRAILEDDGTAFTPLSARALHETQRGWLARELAVPFAGKTVAVTHHAPHAGSIHPRFANDLTSAAFASDMTELLGTASLHVHGHTHDSFDYFVGKTRIVANPMGYCRGIKDAVGQHGLQRENALFNARLVVEI